MKPEEKIEIAGLISTAAKVKDAEHEANYKLIDFKLGTILKQTTLHNQRMTKVEEKCREIEKADLTKMVNCPLVEKVRTLEDASLTSKAIKKWFIGTVAGTGGVVSIFWMLWMLFGK